MKVLTSHALKSFLFHKQKQNHLKKMMIYIEGRIINQTLAKVELQRNFASKFKFFCDSIPI